MGYNIAIGLYVLDMRSVLCVPLAIELYIMDMWSVLCVPHVGGWVWYGERTGHTGHNNYS